MSTKSQRIHQKGKQTKSSAPVKLNWASQKKKKSKSKTMYSMVVSHKCYRVIKLGKGGDSIIEWPEKVLLKWEFSRYLQNRENEAMQMSAGRVS